MTLQKILGKTLQEISKDYHKKLREAEDIEGHAIAIRHLIEREDFKMGRTVESEEDIKEKILLMRMMVEIQGEEVMESYRCYTESLKKDK